MTSGKATNPAQYIAGDARSFDTDCLEADVVITSPPYWKKRDYGLADQLGQEPTPEAFAERIVTALNHWRKCLRPHGSVFLNLGDTYRDKSLCGVPDIVARTAREHDWNVRAKIQWTKTTGSMPSPVDSRLANCHEAIYWLTDSRTDTNPVSDPWRFRVEYPEDRETVWTVSFDRNADGHLAPFPRGLPERCMALAAPESVCTQCGTPSRRVVSDSAHDALSAALSCFQNTHAELPSQRKELHKQLTNRTHLSGCDCEAETEPPTILDPFVGTGTTVEAALNREYRAVGVDLDPPDHRVQPTLAHFG